MSPRGKALARRANPTAAARDLMLLWSDRDERYRQRKHLGMWQPLTPLEARAVQDFRAMEVTELPIDQQAPATARLAAWVPPMVGL